MAVLGSYRKSGSYFSTPIASNTFFAFAVNPNSLSTANHRCRVSCRHLCAGWMRLALGLSVAALGGWWVSLLGVL